MVIISWFSLLSKRQRYTLLGTILVMVVIVALGLRATAAIEEPTAETFTTEMPIRQITPEIGVTGRALARELKLDLEVPKGKPLKALGVSEEQLQHAVEHLLSHKDATLKYFVYVALSLFAVVFLTELGRPSGTDIKERKSWYPRAPYLLILLVSVVVCGFFLGKSPNPMEGFVKVLKSAVGLYPDPVIKVLAFLFFISLVVVGNKVICGWACPLGALQELIFSLPILRRVKRAKLRFGITNTVRALLFLVVLLLLFGIVGGRKGFVVYHYMNAFDLFNLGFDPISIPITIGVVLVVALAVYRPFCHFICPFGLISWLAEKLSVARVNVDQEKCTKCGACVKACPSEAAKGRVARNKLPADCFSCMRCLNVCPVDAIEYGVRKRRLAKDADPAEASE
jgi:NAD-dependent dihydropyrimidine dehydrogenase PreA subunit